MRRTAHAVPSLCAAGATVVRTRSTQAPDLTPSIRGCADAGVAEAPFVAEQPDGWSVGAGTSTGEPRPGAQALQPSLTRFVSTPPLKRHVSPGSRGWLPRMQYVVVVEAGLLEMLISTVPEPRHFIPWTLWK